MKKVEIQRSNLTESQFKAQCRMILRKAGMGAWADTIDKDLGQRNGFCNKRYNDNGELQEIVTTKIGENQLYLKESYNFIYEYTPYNDDGGFGYLYVVEID